ncbi:MAG: extracellular solute-binding protein [Herpetosiphonaceae bacterium]|nr:extracellular solute-binding protein [Herpetosiphonaceae bacterium]
MSRQISVFLLFSLLTIMLGACGSSVATNSTGPTVAANPSAADNAPTTSTGAMSAAATSAAATSAAVTSAPATSMAATSAPATSVAAASAGPTSKPAPTLTPVPLIAQPAGSTKITFWYGLTGANGNIIRTLVNKYNSSQSKYYVEAIQQPDYDATITKFNTSLAGGDLPNVVQVYDIGTQRMIDTKRILPVQNFIDQEKLTLVNDLEPAVARYYTIGGKLYSMPFNSSAPVMYYDRNAFKEVGLDPEKKIWTYDELLDAAKKLTKKDASGKIIRSGIDFTLYSWIFEQELATQSALFADPTNGRESRATKVVFNNDAGAKWLAFLKQTVDQGIGRNIGRDSGTTNGAVRDANFVKGDAAITFNSIAALRGYINGAKTSGKVDVGVAYLPRPAGAKGGVIIGGASLWITDQGTAAQQAGAWDFVKWTSSAEVQASWSSNTGYYPIRKAAYDVQVMKDTLAKYPQFGVAVEQLRATEATFPTQGAVFGTFLQTRLAIEAAMEQFMTGKVADAKAALNDAASKSNDALDEYNSTQK